MLTGLPLEEMRLLKAQMAAGGLNAPWRWQLEG